MLRVLVMWVAVAAAACGGNRVDPEIVRAATYRGDRATIFTAALDVMRLRFHAIEANAERGTIRTAWDQVPFASTTSTEDGGVIEENNGRGGKFVMHAASSNVVFARYDVMVEGDDATGWRIVVQGYASMKRSGYVEPLALRGADEPPWLGPSTDHLAAALYDALHGYRGAMPVPRPPSPIPPPPMPPM